MFNLHETVPHQNETEAATNIAEFLGSNEVLQDPEQRRDYLAHLEPADFLTLTQQVNNAVRGGDMNDPHPLDGKEVRLVTHDVPDQQDKEQLMLELWDGARTILNDESLSTEKALRYSSLLAGGGIALIHPFIDSNGRTSRTMARMIDGGTDDSFEADMQEILGSRGGRFFQLAAPGVPHYTEAAVPHRTLNKYGRDFSDIKDVTYVTSDSGQEEWFIGDIEDQLTETGVLEDLFRKQFKGAVLNDFVKLVDENGWKMIQKHVDGDGTLRFGDALQEMSQGEGGIGYMAQIRELERGARADFVRRFIQSMTQDTRVPFYGSDREGVERIRQGVKAYPVLQRFGELLIDQAVDDTIQPRQAYDALHTAYSSKHNPDDKK